MTERFLEAQRRTFTAIAVLALLSCGHDVLPPTTLNLTPAGGTLNLLGNLIQLIVPAGAVSQSVNVSAQSSTTAPASALLASGTAVDLSPSGLTFAQPVTISINAGIITPPTGVLPRELRVNTVVNGAWSVVPGSAYDSASNTVTASITHFSTYGLLGVPAQTVSINRGNLAVASGATLLLTAVVKDSTGLVLPNRAIAWSSATPSIASIDAVTGVLTGGGSVGGKTLITATVEGKQDTATITVISPTPTPVLAEDYMTYTSTANLKTNPLHYYSDNFLGDGNESYNTTQIFLDTTTGYAPSTHSMRYDYPIINQADYTIGVNIKFPAAYTEAWVEVAHKFSTTFTTLGPANGGADYKFIMARVHGIAGARFMLFCGTYGTGFVFGYPGNDPGSNSNTAPYYGNTAFAFTNFGTPWDGQWHLYRFHYKVGNPGAAEWWFDGHKMPGFPPSMNTDVSAATDVYGLALGRNLNKGTSQTMQEWWGHVFVYNQNPGWQ